MRVDGWNLHEELAAGYLAVDGRGEKVGGRRVFPTRRFSRLGELR